jgi:hypothetical protein
LRSAGLMSLERLVSAVGEFWCSVAHREITTPMWGHYRCRRCHRVYHVPWESTPTTVVPLVGQFPYPRTAEGSGRRAAWPGNGTPARAPTR